MASRNSTRAHTSRTTQEAGSDATQASADASRQHLLATSQSMAAWIRAAVLLQEAQLQALQRCGAAYQEAADRIEQARGPLELLTAQSGLMMNGLQLSMQYGVDLMNAIPAMQSALARQSPTSGAAATPTAMGAFQPMVDAWQSVLNAAPHNGSGASATH